MLLLNESIHPSSAYLCTWLTGSAGVCHLRQGNDKKKTKNKEVKLLLAATCLFPFLGFPFTLLLRQHMLTAGQGQTPAGSDPVLPTVAT